MNRIVAALLLWSFAANASNTIDLSGSIPFVVPGTNGNVLTSNGTSWVSSPASGGSGITALTGDVAATGPGSAVATIQALAVTNSKIANSTIDLTSKVTGVLPATNGGSPGITRQLYVDNGRTDTFTADGSWTRPFATIGAAVTQIITNADNSTHPYSIIVESGTYNETVTLNSSTLTNLTFVANGNVTINNPATTVLQSTANNTQLSNLSFTGFTINGALNLSGDINNSNFGSVAIVFTNCSFGISGSTVTLFDVNNVSFYGGQFNGASSTITITNTAFAYIQGAEGLHSGITLNLVQNGGLNQPSQTLGNYLLLSTSKLNSITSIDAGSELDMIQSYQNSSGTLTNNGTIHSFHSIWEGTTTLNNGSTTRVDGDVFRANPTINAGATLTSRGDFQIGTVSIGSSAVPATNAVIVYKDGHVKGTQTTVPTATVQAAAGTGASCVLSHAVDDIGQIQITFGSASFATGAQCNVNFNKAFGVAPICRISPANASAANDMGSNHQVYVTATTSAMSINYGLAQNSAGAVNQWNYSCEETQ